MACSAEVCPVCASTGHFPRVASTTTSTRRRFSLPVSDQNSLITPPQKMPSICRPPVSRSRSARSAASSSSPDGPNGAVVAAHSPVKVSRAACLASSLRVLHRQPLRGTEPGRRPGAPVRGHRPYRVRGRRGPEFDEREVRVAVVDEPVQLARAGQRAHPGGQPAHRPVGAQQPLPGQHAEHVMRIGVEVRGRAVPGPVHQPVRADLPGPHRYRVADQVQPVPGVPGGHQVRQVRRGEQLRPPPPRRVPPPGRWAISTSSPRAPACSVISRQPPSHSTFSRPTANRPPSAGRDPRPGHHVQQALRGAAPRSAGWPPSGPATSARPASAPGHLDSWGPAQACSAQPTPCRAGRSPGSRTTGIGAPRAARR